MRPSPKRVLTPFLELVERLAETQTTLVLAESCTGGLVSAKLTAVPGVSQWLAGSMVVYQEASKIRWLGVDQETLELHSAVSAPVAHQMVQCVLQATPHADLAASVTGHIGPGAPAELDGRIFVGVGFRGHSPQVAAIQLSKTKREARQREAAQRVVETLLESLGTD